MCMVGSSRYGRRPAGSLAFMALVGRNQIVEAAPQRALIRLVPLVIVILASLLLHLMLLSIIRWPGPVGMDVLEIVTLDLQPAAAIPEPIQANVAPNEAPSPQAHTVASPSSIQVPLPELLAARVPSKGNGLGGSGLGMGAVPGADPQVQVGPLRIGARRVVFMVDVSSSMRGSFRDGTTLGEVAAQAVCTAMNGLPESVQFRLMCFSGGLNEPLGSQWRWKRDADMACNALEQVAAEASGLTRTSALFDQGGLGDARADAVVLVTDGGILDLEAGALQRWIDLAPTIQLDVVLIGPVSTPTETQRRLARMARGTGGGVHRLFGSTR